MILGRCILMRDESSNVKTKKRFFKPIVIISFTIILGVGIYIYWYAVDPILDFVLGAPHYETTDINVYSSEKYLKFRYGKNFKNYLEEVKPEGEVVSFYYINHYGQDNPVYGRQLDVYALDMKLEEIEYETFRIQMIQDSHEKGSFGDYLIYLSDVIDEDGNQFLFLCNDEKYIVRFIMMTDAPDLKSTIVQTLFMRFINDLEFE